MLQSIRCVDERLGLPSPSTAVCRTAGILSTIEPLLGNSGTRRWSLTSAQPQFRCPMSACVFVAGGDRPDVGERATGVPGWKASYERRGAVEADAAVAG